MDEDAALSDQDSLSLLKDLPAWQSRGAAEIVTAVDSGTQTDKKEIKHEINVNQQNQNQNQSVTPHSLNPDTGSSSGNERIKRPRFLHKRNGKGETYLHTACRRNDLAQVKWLIQAGIGVNLEDHAGWTALHEAAKVGAEAVVEELLKAGADVNAGKCDGVTPLHDAVSSGSYQVVKLLLQNGSNPCDREISGSSAFDMAKDQDMKELLATFRTSVTQQRHFEEAEPRAPPVTVSPECRVISMGHFPTEPRVGGGANELRDDAAAGSDYVLRAQSHSMTVAAVLEDLRRKQTEIPTWPLKDLKDADKYREALTQIQSVLAFVVDKQCLEKENLKEKYRTVPHHFHQTLLKGQFLALASCQRKLVEILQHQKHLEQAYVTAKNKMLNHTSNHCRPAVQVRRKHAAVQTRAEDERCLRRLLQGGVLTAGSSLRLTLKGKQHVAHVGADGAVVSKGKVHRAPERWLESILGKNIPVSSTYALEKVTFRDKPLSHYFLNMEAEENGGGCSSAVQEPTPEAGNWCQMLKNIKMIHLVSDEEFLPSAVMDYYWDKLLRQTPSELEDWDSEL
ncbi:putative ankyrin repeat domain-containing protein 31 [Austrofundulus limnaeus]|uniref:Ankyrin repeat domain-containing protein 31 n=1 Tax=Austrofundulus limnaeus TaxID=52670 RepID=A0A2I4BQP6_AUSLI|nr:PREDICTED: putative ankyrin repeat domain-containing protein 31 [Austrofundulus limnaeus]XP_013870053.1 PREDICTED: putative ankyrin repeat domain-containing protein 31 [Austrofundulus limnaeus]